MTARALATWMAGGLLALLCGGCLGLFDPDTPEPPPAQNCATDFTGDYTTPSAVLRTLSGAMSRKARGRCAYIAAFADSAADGVTYRATFPADLVAERVALDLVVPDWVRSMEAVFYDDFMELSESNYALVWTAWPEAGSDLGGASDSTLFRRYVVTPTGGAEILTAGTAVLEFRRLPDGRWVLAHWTDDIDERRLDPANGVDRTALLDMTVSSRRLEAFDANF